jgi:hypothetical protein
VFLERAEAVRSPLLGLQVEVIKRDLLVDQAEQVAELLDVLGRAWPVPAQEAIAAVFRRDSCGQPSRPRTG